MKEDRGGRVVKLSFQARAELGFNGAIVLGGSS